MAQDEEDVEGTEPVAAAAPEAEPSHDADEPDGADPDDGAEALEAQAEEAAPAPEAAAPAGPGTLLIERAVRSGMDATEIDKWHAAGALPLAVEMREKLQAQTQIKEKPDSSGKGAEAEKETVIPDLDPEGFDEPLVALAKSMKAAVTELRAKNLALLERISKREENDASRDVDARHERFDGELPNLPGGKELFGSGRGNTLGADSKELANRRQLWDALARVERGYAGNNEQPPSFGEMVKQAHRLAFGDVMAKNAVQRAASQLKERQGQLTQRPTARDGSDMETPQQSALRKVRAWQEKSKTRSA